MSQPISNQFSDHVISYQLRFLLFAWIRKVNNFSSLRFWEPLDNHNLTFIDLFFLGFLFYKIHFVQDHRFQGVLSFSCPISVKIHPVSSNYVHHKQKNNIENSTGGYRHTLSIGFFQKKYFTQTPDSR